MNLRKQKGNNLTEKHIFGDDPRLRCVRSSPEDERDWLENQPICPSLAHYQILHAGIMEANYPYEVVRTCQEGAFFIVTLRGNGRILVNGAWHDCGEGQACLLPAYTTNAFHCIQDGGQWDFCWVRYHHPPEQIPLIASSEPIIDQFSIDQFNAAMQGLLFEAEQEHREAISEQWVLLIHTYVREFVAPHQTDERLWRLWDAVEHNLGSGWTLDIMARTACLSAEHLRRLCKAQHGRSPMQQVRWLRMQRAAAMLVTTDFKIEAIACDVGYKNPIVFSTAFKKHFQLQPSKYRSQQASIRE